MSLATVLIAIAHAASPSIGSGHATYFPAPLHSLPMGAAMGAQAADMNGDGRDDFVVAGVGNPSTLSVALRRSDGSFARATASTLLGTPVDTAIADIDSDGALDVLVAVAPYASASALAVHYGLGDGTLEPGPPAWMPVLYPVLTCAAGDLDADGHVDLVAGADPNGSYVGPIKVVYGQGNRHFAFPTFGGFGLAQRDLHVIDLDHDGRPDLAALARMDNTLDWYIAWSRNLGGHHDFAPPVLTLVQPFPWRKRELTLSDLDDDGTFDATYLLSPSDYGPWSLQALRGLGRGRFASAVGYEVGFHAARSALVDCDGDLAPDILVPTRNSVGGGASRLSVLRNRGDGTFALELQGSGLGDIDALAATDLDSDGRDDLIACPHVAPNASFYPLPARSDGRYEPWQAIEFSQGVRAVADADVDGDGRRDVVVGGYAGIHVARRMPGDVYVLSQSPTTIDTAFQRFAVARFNTDARDDLVEVRAYSGLGSFFRIHFGRANGTFEAGPEVATGGGYYTAVTTGDFDLDQKVDLLFNPYLGPLVWHRQLSPGQFAAPLLIPLGGYAYAGQCVPADLDGDGRLDVACLLARGATWDVAVVPNQGPGAFGRVLTVATDYQPSQLVVSDLDGDGRLDLLVDDGNRIDWLAGLGELQFAAPVTLDAQANQNGYSDWLLDDFDGDSMRDLVALDCPARSLRLRRGLGGGRLAEPELTLGGETQRMLSADMDHDGRRDLVLWPSSGQHVYILDQH